MKTKNLLSIAFYILCMSSAIIPKAQTFEGKTVTDSIRVFSSPDLYKLTSIWVSEYGKIKQNVKFKVYQFQDDQTGAWFNDNADLYFISNEFHSIQKDESVLKMVVGVEAFVPIINSKNPFIDEIYFTGISPIEMSQMLLNSNHMNWGKLLESSKDSPVNFYMVKNDFSRAELANFLKLKSDLITGIVVENDEDLIAAIQKDPFGLGFSPISKTIDVKTNEVLKGINFLPIDRNNNGRIDSNEKIYNDLNEFLHGIWIGKYPKELSRNIYSVSAVKPINESLVDFLGWVITDGQKHLNANGFSDLTSNLRRKNIAELYKQDLIDQPSKSSSVIPIVAIILLVFVMLFFVVDYVLHISRRAKVQIQHAVEESCPFFDDSSIDIPDGLYFDKSHTWAFMEKDGVVGIGVDDFLQNIIGPITKVKMKESGAIVKKGEIFLTLIQDGKQLNIKSPLSGTIKSQNKKLISNSSLINKSPYNDGWIYKIEPANWLVDIQFLIFAQGYKEWLKMEFMHLKDFFAIALRPAVFDKTQVVLQDGGVIRKGILKDLKPEVWEDFQTHFLDSPK